MKNFLKTTLGYYTNSVKNINSLEFFITEKCNYNCEYCFSGFSPDREHANNETIDSFIDFIKSLKLKTRVKLIGGEPVFHPRFVEVASLILKNNHKLVVGTNFSLHNKYFEKIFNEAKEDSRMDIIISLHLSQIESIDDFIKKIIDLKKYGGEKVNISVVSVMLEEKFTLLLKIRNDLIANNITMSFQRLKIEAGGFHRYPEEIEDYLREQFPKRKASKIEFFNPYGVLCKTGYLFVRISADGSVYRCYNYHEELFSLGNINDKYKVLKKSMPCLSDKCTCLLPVSQNLIEFDKTDINLAKRIQLEKTFYGTMKRIAKKIRKIR